MSGSLPQYGVTATGFVKKRLPEIRSGIVDSLSALTGKTIETGPSTFMGQLIDTFAEREAELWEKLEALYHARFPRSATGIALDHAVSFVGVRRNVEARSEARIIAYGDQGVIVPAGAVIRTTVEKENFIVSQNILITNTNVSDIGIRPTSAVANATYSITVNGQVYSVNSGVNPSTLSIAQLLTQALQPTGYEVSSNGDEVSITDTLHIGMSVAIGARLQVSRRGTAGRVYAQNYGPVSVDERTITEIVSTVPGWSGVTNIAAGVQGRLAETDEELLRRYSLGVFRTGAGTLPSIEANLIEKVPGLSDARAYHNNTTSEDAEGRPPVSVEVVTKGGDPQVIANTLFGLVAGGVGYFGNTERQVVDRKGDVHDVSFSVVEPVYIWIRLSMERYTEEAERGGTLDAAVNAIVRAGDSYQMGQDVFPQRLFGPIYEAVSGIGRIVVELAATTNPFATPQPSDYSTNKVSVSPRQEALFDASRVSGVIVDPI